MPPAQVDGPNRNFASAAFIPWGGGPLLSWKLAACPPGKFLTHNRCPAPVVRQDVSMCSRAVKEVSKSLQNRVNCIRFLLSPDGPHAVYFEQGEDVAAQGSGTSGLTASENAEPQPRPARRSTLRRGVLAYQTAPRFSLTRRRGALPERECATLRPGQLGPTQCHPQIRLVSSRTVTNGALTRSLSPPPSPRPAVPSGKTRLSSRLFLSAHG